jgi:hypothetical protein
MVEHFRDSPFVKGLEASTQDPELIRNPQFRRWLTQNTVVPKQAGYRAVYLSPRQGIDEVTFIRQSRVGPG